MECVKIKMEYVNRNNFKKVDFMNFKKVDFMNFNLRM